MEGLKVLLAVGTLGVALAGCQPPPIHLEFAFHNEETFVYSEAARVVMLQADSGGGTNCAAVLDWLINNIGSFEPQQEHRQVNVCDLYNGLVTFDDIGEGRKVFAALVRAINQRTLLTGCYEGEISLGTESVRVPLGLSLRPQDYDELKNDINTTYNFNCSGAREKCQGGC